jgi:hypothetical protein
MAIKQPKMKVRAEIGNILRGTGISNQLAKPYCTSKTISKPNTGGFYEL